ncbi:MAG: transketolase [Alphaproteobacteria bacterium]
MPDGVAISASSKKTDILETLSERALWLSSWMIHHANHIRENRGGVKVGGHQASSASCAQILTSLYFHALRPEDRVAVKPHASPVYHAIQYMLGRQTKDQLVKFRSLGGAQAYPSRTKDIDDVDFSTGSVGLGAAMTVFSSLAQDMVELHGGMPNRKRGRMIAVVGDAELDEGNVFECLLEGWKHDLRDCWWIIDYNRQSLDSVVSDRLFQRIDGIFEAMGWKVITLKYGRRLERAFREKGGAVLRQWIDDCPNSIYSALTFKGGAAWRERLTDEIGSKPGIKQILSKRDDKELARMMTDLAGHCIETLTEAFDEAAKSDVPTCFIAYTIKGFGLPLAGHQDNHAGLMTPEQIDVLKQEMGVESGQEWEVWSGVEGRSQELQAFVENVPFAQRKPLPSAGQIAEALPMLPVPGEAKTSTQEGFGRILASIARSESILSDRIVTTSPDVTISTNLGGWVNRKGVFERHIKDDAFRKENIPSTQRWAAGPKGQHLELGIAENNLFLALAALGLTEPLYGHRLLPVGTLYDPFIARGLDALIYALYQDARFLIVGTPSGVTLSPEGGAHQSQTTPLIGMGLPNLVSYEPAFVDELAVMMRESFNRMLAEDGGATYLRLSTRQLDQPTREMTLDLQHDILAGAYWVMPPGPNCDVVIAAMGALMPEAISAHKVLLEDCPDAGLLAVTSPDQLHKNWLSAEQGVEESHLTRLFAEVPQNAGIVTICDAHPATLSWLGASLVREVVPLGVEGFGQSADLPDLYRSLKIDSDAIVDAAARLIWRLMNA